jgi:DNA-binding transcriptional LysR family regulator
VEGTFHTFLDDLHVPIVDPYHFLRLFLLRGTDMVTLTYEKLACSVLKDADIRIVEPQFEVGPVEIGMMWHPQDAADPGHRWLREQLMRVAMTL